MARTVVTVAIVMLSLLHQVSGGTLDITIMKLIVPEHPRRFTNVTLQCIYESKEEPLFIKWSHNGLEFLKFQPKDTTDPLTVFEDENIEVIMEETTGDKVVLREVDFKASGNYTCTVVGEHPDFKEDEKTKLMTVTGIPDEQPSIEGDVRDHYAVGDIVNLTCTTPPSIPAATLSWLINGDKAPAEYLHECALEKTQEGLFISRLRLNFQLSESHFIERELSLKCIASIATFYQGSDEHSQQGPPKPPGNAKEVRPLPEGGSLVTIGTSGCISVWGSLLHRVLLHTVLIISASLLH